MTFNCELLNDDRVVVKVRGAAETGDVEWIIDTVIEGCDAAQRAGASLVVDMRQAHIGGLLPADRLVHELRHLCGEAGVDLALRRSELTCSPGTRRSAAGWRSVLGLS